MKVLAIVLMSVTLCLPAMGGDVLVSAASSLTLAVKEITVAYKKKYRKDNITLNFAGSGSLRGQIERGAPVDLFLSASSRHMDILVEKDLLVKGSRIDFATNTLCLISPLKNPRVTIKSVLNLINKKITRIAIGSPKSVPVGRYAKELLTSLKLWALVRPKLIYGGNVRQVLDYVARGEVDFGLVYETDAIARKGEVTIVERLNPKNHSPIIYPVAVIKGTKQLESAKHFSQFLKSDIAQGILVKHGFSVK